MQVRQRRFVQVEGTPGLLQSAAASDLVLLRYSPQIRVAFPCHRKADIANALLSGQFWTSHFLLFRDEVGFAVTGGRERGGVVGGLAF